ncbi:hypothetical protein JHK85_005488 [Glycine max]|nr:hypothetical protein JHK85_005488 [Glycine max]KAG5081259.1 hypothetical protein JHK86_005324 [Glycine max]
MEKSQQEPHNIQNLEKEVRGLLEELAMVVEEIIKLERKVKELELRLLQERYQNIDLEIQHRRQSKLYNHF